MRLPGAQPPGLNNLSAGASIAQRVAALLLGSPTDTVSRAELRRALPAGRPRPTPIVKAAKRETAGKDVGSSVGNTMTNAMRCAIRDFERRGLVERVGGDVRIRDRAGLAQLTQEAA